MRLAKVKLSQIKIESYTKKIRCVVADIEAILARHPERSRKFGSVLFHMLSELKKGK